MDRASKPSSGAVLKFVAASGFGAAMLLLPVPHDGSLHILLGLITGAVQDSAASVLPALVTATCVVSATATLGYSLFTRPHDETHVAELLLRPGLVWTILRVLGRSPPPSSSCKSDRNGSGARTSAAWCSTI
mgnify:CR=1 FL=1